MPVDVDAQGRCPACGWRHDEDGFYLWEGIRRGMRREDAGPYCCVACRGLKYRGKSADELLAEVEAEDPGRDIPDEVQAIAGARIAKILKPYMHPSRGRGRGEHRDIAKALDAGVYALLAPYGDAAAMRFTSAFLKVFTEIKKRQLDGLAVGCLWDDAAALDWIAARQPRIPKPVVESVLRAYSLYQAVAGLLEPTDAETVAEAEGYSLEALRKAHHDCMPRQPGVITPEQEAVFIMRQGISLEATLEVVAQLMAWSEYIGVMAPGAEAAHREWSLQWKPPR